VKRQRTLIGALQGYRATIVALVALAGIVRFHGLITLFTRRRKMRKITQKMLRDLFYTKIERDDAAKGYRRLQDEILNMHYALDAEVDETQRFPQGVFSPTFVKPGVDRPIQWQEAFRLYLATMVSGMDEEDIDEAMSRFGELSRKERKRNGSVKVVCLAPMRANSAKKNSKKGHK